jgi:predicted nucleotidyltransferase
MAVILSIMSAATALLNSDVLNVCREASLQTRQELDTLLAGKIGKYTSEDTSLIVFGSLARGEWTSSSDLDWTYLIDGEANSDHLDIAQKIRKVFKDNDERFRAPGQTETFGNLAFSHDIIHQIGGEHDTNKNTTRRILLLLESCAIGNRTEAYERVIRGVIDRYLKEDSHHLLTPDSTKFRVPRFLLNDIVRFWRTMAVDFASKQRDRGRVGWGLRNAKLRMSRKLIFASGLLVCFGPNLDPELHSQISTDKNDIKLKLVNYIRDYARLTPPEIVASSMDRYSVPASIAEQFLAAYTEFLKLLSDKESRDVLDRLRSEDSRTDPTFKKIRKISEQFEGALDHLFFENPQVAPLTRKYGVF